MPDACFCSSETHNLKPMGVPVPLREFCLMLFLALLLSSQLRVIRCHCTSTVVKDAF